MMADSLLFKPEGESTPAAQMKARLMSIALHAFVSSLLVGKFCREKPNATPDQMRDFLAARMEMLAQHCMAIYPRAEGIEEIAAISVLFDLDCTLDLGQPKERVY